MGDNDSPGGATQVKVTYLELSDAERKIADATIEQAKSVLVQGFRDEITKLHDEWKKETDPSTRPGFSAATSPKDGEIEIDIKSRYGAMKRAVVDKASGRTVRWAPVDTVNVLPNQVLGETKGGWLPSNDMGPDIRDEVAGELGRTIDELAKKDAGFAVLKFPRGDIENFSVCRWAMACEKERNTNEGTAAYNRHAPWEYAYYQALESYQQSKGDTWTKAQGDMVSGQDGGFIAPEAWSTSLIDQIYPSDPLSVLPITRINMGTRVVHVPRLSANIQVNWASENASLTANQAQFQQVSFTARKQAAFIQISNELIRDSNPAAEQILRGNAAKYMALDQAWQVLLGNGLAGTPTGLYNQTNVTAAVGTHGGGFTGAAAPTAVGTNSKYPVLPDLVTAIFNVEDLNQSTNVPIGQANCTGIVGPVALKMLITASTDAALGVSSGSDRPLYDFGYNQMRWANRNDGTTALDGFLGVPTWVLSNTIKHSLGSGGASAAPAVATTSPLSSPPTSSTLVAGNTSPVFFGDWQHLWLMTRSDIEILTSNVAGTAFASDQTWIRLIRRLDVGVAHPEPFYVVTNG